jgi:hypothetical protein
LLLNFGTLSPMFGQINLLLRLPVKDETNQPIRETETDPQRTAAPVVEHP